MRSEVWIALVGVVPKNGNALLDEKVGGAYVNVLAYASGLEDFQERVKLELDRRDFQIIEIENPEPFRLRVKHYEVAKEIKVIARHVERDKDIQFATFHTFPLEGAN